MLQVPHVGKTCGAARCGQHDFLPWTCDGCGGVFCEVHAKSIAHGCTAQRAQKTHPGGSQTVPLYKLRCIVCSSAALISCSDCGYASCVPHRHHQCSQVSWRVWAIKHGARITTPITTKWSEAVVPLLPAFVLRERLSLAVFAGILLFLCVLRIAGVSDS
jgi:predicted nucleic acid binding AN1-type Zn finger protein